MTKGKTLTFLMIIALLMLTLPIHAQDAIQPTVVVDGQVVVDDTVRITEVVSDGDGFIVIHSADEDGGFGEVIGYTPVSPGINHNVVVEIEPTLTTATLFAILHTDDGVMGDFEFGEIEDGDAPVVINDGIIASTFNVEVLSASDQFVDQGLFVVDSAVVSADGFVVVHADNGEGAPGEVLGAAPIVAGTSTNVVVELSGGITDILFPMLHVDTNEVGEYEFGSVEGADSPVAIDGTVATKPIWTIPHMRIPDQPLASGDTTLVVGAMLDVDSVLSEGPGFVVIHADNGEGVPGEVIGYAAVEDGLTTDISVEIDGVLTPVVYPMLHTDTDTIGEYEFGVGGVSDLPVTINDEVVMFPIDIFPSIVFDGILQDNLLTIEKAIIDQGGWLVIHADNGEGAPGQVIGASRLREGVNYDVTVELDTDMMTDTVFPMLHYDTGEIGTYEFGTVDDTDLPVIVDDIIVTGAMEPIVID